MPQAEITAATPAGWRWLGPTAAGAAGMAYGVLAVARGAFNFWSVAVGAVGLGVVVDRLLAFRPSFIRADGDVLTVRSHLGLTDRRVLDSLLTVEWHSQSWRDSIVFNFVDYADNVRVSAAGYSVDAIEHFAATVGKHFIVIGLDAIEPPN